ncbi:MAG: DUF2911 domain-containing protein, partial [Thermoanaerobaculia bacterium]
MRRDRSSSRLRRLHLPALLRCTLVLWAISGAAGWAATFPAGSPRATLTQMVGFDEIEITYSRPRVRGRTIWGALVPYGEIWRTGANYPTKITFPSEVQIEGRPLAEGSYALYTIPGEGAWTIIFSRNTELWGAFGYNLEDDALRVSVEPRPAEHAESFTIEFADVTGHSAILTLLWERLAVPIRIEVDTAERVAGNIELVLQEEGEDTTWGFYWRAAQYLLEHDADLERALDFIQRSLKMERNWMNV